MSVTPNSASGLPASPIRNLQAKGTVGILNTVRWIGTGVFGLLAALMLLAALFAFVTSGGPGYAFAGVVFAALLALVAALIYAVVGWFVDSLNLLVQIEKNTQARA